MTLSQFLNNNPILQWFHDDVENNTVAKEKSCFQFFPKLTGFAKQFRTKLF